MLRNVYRLMAVDTLKSKNALKILAKKYQYESQTPLKNIEKKL